MLIAFYVDFFYNVIIAWSLRFFFASITDVLPWTSCTNSWNTNSCKPVDGSTIYLFIYWSKLTKIFYLQFDSNYTRPPSATTPSLISTTVLPILNSTSTAISNQTSSLNATVQNVTSHSFSSASSEYFNRFILEIHESDGIHDLGIIKWEMASKRIPRQPTEGIF